MARIPIARRVTTAKLMASKGAYLGMNSAMVRDRRARASARREAQSSAGL
jgi:hypothetical protein